MSDGITICFFFSFFLTPITLLFVGLVINKKVQVCNDQEKTQLKKNDNLTISYLNLENI